MFKKAFLKAASPVIVTPVLVSSILYEVATNHHPAPHSNRSERMEQETRRAYESNNSAALRFASRPGSGSGGGNGPQPSSPTEETVSRAETRGRRGETNQPSLKIL